MRKKRCKKRLRKSLLTKCFISAGLAALLLGSCGKSEGQERTASKADVPAASRTEQEKKDSVQMVEAIHTPYGKYPETVTYTLGKISGANHANLPVGATYEDNAYTQYLKKMLNIQNKDVFEL